MFTRPRPGRHATTTRRKLPVTTALLARRARDLERHLPGAIAGDDKGVHQARVASRRLREGLPVLAAGLRHGRKAERKVRKVTQALGTVREMDVTVSVLDELARNPAIPRDALEDVRGHVLAERERRRGVMLDRLGDLNTEKLARRLHEVAADSSEFEGSPWRDALAKRIARRAKRFASAIASAGQIYAPDRLHRVRIATKKLRYALELAADVRIQAARPLLAALKRTQETLGRLNDLHVILGHVAAVQASPPKRHRVNRRGLDVIAATLEAECRHLHARYLKQAPALLALAGTCESEIVPRVAVTPGRRTLAKATHARTGRGALADRI